MISVCIATYNGAPYITEQLASICAQLSDNDEIIVSDDGSTDGTLDVVRAFGDSRINIVCNQSQRCYTANFENALTTSRVLSVEPSSEMMISALSDN